MINGADDAVYAMWFGLQVSKDSSKIEIINNFSKESGNIKWINIKFFIKKSH